jgi:phospholipid/cholesterol/gamma-HCH transport system ATP-binding protein
MIPNTPTLVTVSEVSATLSGTPILRNISFNVGKGEIFTIIGGSGTGKTTLMRALLGLIQPDSGNITINGLPCTPRLPKTLRRIRQQIGAAFQSGALLRSMTVLENVELPLLINTRLDKRTIRIMSRLKLEMVNILEAEDLFPSQLSGGMLKRASLARAIATDPKILFFDEPSAGLDPQNAASLDELILKLKDIYGMTIVIVTHSMESAKKIADTVLVLKGGEVCWLGSKSELDRTNDPYLRSFLDRSPVSQKSTSPVFVERLTS